jgi:hypothetical protein
VGQSNWSTKGLGATCLKERFGLTCELTNLFPPFGAQGRIKWDGVGVGHSPSATPSQKTKARSAVRRISARRTGCLPILPSLQPADQPKESNEPTKRRSNFVQATHPIRIVGHRLTLTDLQREKFDIMPGQISRLPR